MKKHLPQILLLFSSAFWGASFIFTKGIFESDANITPLIIISARMFVASLVTIPVLLLSRSLEKIRRKDFLWFLLLAALEPFLYSICETSGISHVSGSLASIIIATIPLLIPFGMALAYKEKLKWRAVWGCALSMLGIVIMSFGDSFTADDGWLGILLLSAAVIVAVLYTLTLVRFLNRYNPMTITAYQNLIALLYFLPLMLLCDGDKLPLVNFSPKIVFFLSFLGVFCSTVAYMCFNYGMKRLGATAGSVYNNIIPVFSLLLALAIGQESLDFSELSSWYKLAGMAVVIVGLSLAQKKNGNGERI